MFISIIDVCQLEAFTCLPSIHYIEQLVILHYLTCVSVICSKYGVLVCRRERVKAMHLSSFCPSILHKQWPSVWTTTWCFIDFWNVSSVSFLLYNSYVVFCVVAFLFLYLAVIHTVIIWYQLVSCIIITLHFASNCAWLVDILTLLFSQLHLLLSVDLFCYFVIHQANWYRKNGYIQTPSKVAVRSSGNQRVVSCLVIDTTSQEPWHSSELQ